MLDPEEHPRHVDPEHPLEVGFLVVDDPGLVLVGDAGVVEHYVELPVSQDGLSDRASHLVLVRHVTAKVGSARRANCRADGASQLVLDIGHHDLGSVSRKDSGGALADPAGSPGDQSDLAL